MFFNTQGIKWTLLVIAGVILLCVLDVHCSNARDRAAAEAEARSAQSGGGAIDFVKRELSAGAREQANLSLDQINAQLRDLRVMANHFVKKGENKRARATIAFIQELEARKAKLEQCAQGEKAH